MELWQAILCDLLKNETMENSFSKTPDHQMLFEMKCYHALRQIQEILRDGALDDKECFERIEEIVRVFERMGSDCGGRHDFG